MFLCSKVGRQVAEFFGVADLTEDERKDFIDAWLTRAAKTHDDDFTLNLHRKSSLNERRSTAMTATQYQLYQATRDATDGRCVAVVICFLLSLLMI